ncbi:MAG: GNAT family N-acetyltransferase [Deltaproteobacteria bacterium]|nr:GNAT family N-acetyltransferase [Deltaproteobacteria bacterium]
MTGDRPPTLATERLFLRELRASDAGAVAAGAGDPRVARFLLDVPSPYPIALARRWITTRIGWWDAGRGATLAIVRRVAPDALLGTVSLRRYTHDRRAELGYWLAADEWGAGLAAEATRSMVEWGFPALGLQRIYAQVLADNRASGRVLDKLGMVLEGMKRQHVRKGTALCDVLLYGLLVDEWVG